MYFTKRQLEVLDFIRHYHSQNQGLTPTLCEMASQFNVSRTTIHGHVEALVKKGVLRKTPNQTRSIELVEEDGFEESHDTCLPILGMIQAGTPSSPFEVPEEFNFTDWIQNPSDYHLLKVTGESMIEDHINEGDLVLVDRKKDAQNGDIVIAATPDGDVTLKRIYREKSGVRLQPSNASMEPMYFDNADVRGVVVGLIRQFH